MIIEELERLVGRYLATGIAVVVIVVSPGPGEDGDRPDGPPVIRVEPAPGSGGERAGGDASIDEDGTGEDAGGGEGAPVEEWADEGGGAEEDLTSAATDGTTAAEVHGWGEPVRVDEFDGPESLSSWNVYDGPGHAGNGRRTPDAVNVSDGVLTITGDSAGNTAGMAWLPGQKYGRWEGRVRAPASDPSYNALLLLWPDAEDFPVGGEIDFMEMIDHTRQKTDIFIHYGPDNSQIHGEVRIDGTEWHNWAVEWTPESITAYVDGREWYRTTDTSVFPPGPMHLCIQLDWFPQGGNPQESRMHVDWVRQYTLDGAPTEDGGASGTGTGEPAEPPREGGEGAGGAEGAATGRDAAGPDAAGQDGADEGGHGGDAGGTPSDEHGDGGDGTGDGTGDGADDRGGTGGEAVPGGTGDGTAGDLAAASGTVPTSEAAQTAPQRLAAGHRPGSSLAGAVRRARAVMR
ncbi:MAG TPA: glycoside hydrolase family 16 protein [Pseudonocardia sp.]|nr:glycoside hydrolase family 16 protein [Pseudonocardia sp.]